MNHFDLVKKVIETYIEGSKRLNYEMATSVVHPEGRMFLGNEWVSKNLYEHWKTDFARHREKYTPEEFYEMSNDEILSIEIDGTIARAKVTSGRWIDYHSLILVNDEWKIVSKISHICK